MQLKNFPKYIAIIIILISFFSGYSFTNAESIEELEENINEYTDKISELDKVINEYKGKLVETSKQANTLQNTVNSLITTEKKLINNIDKTETNIEKSSLTIKKLALEINDKEAKIEKNTAALEQTIRNLNTIENTPLLESIFLYDDLSEFWNALHSLEKFQDGVQDLVVVLKDLNSELKGKKGETENEISYLEDFKVELAGEKEVIQYTKKEKADILASTRNKESTYQSILAQKMAEKKKFEEALLEFESKLQILIDPDSFPDATRGVIGWPVSPVIITQNFGGTQFAKSNPGIYGRPYHNGTDFGIPIGTPVSSVLSGTVRDTGNTDAFPGCRSWGKWVLVEHNNGLTSLYAHLSSIQVSKGQKVEQGERIALSGSTGVSTGPHLHLTLYASQGVQVRYFSDFKQGSTGCAATGASTPVADLNAYLDPMSYLPKL